jgi:type IV pilus assembly protein PilB
MLNAEIVNKDEEIIRFVDELLERAVKEGATSIYIEPKEKHTRVRFRIDGKVITPEGYSKILKPLHSYIVDRIKMLTKVMKLDVKYQPQDGKISTEINGRKCEFRIGTLPTIHGESVTILIVFERTDIISIEDIFNNDTKLMKVFKKNISVAEGMIVFSGVTGSGKMSVALSALNEISKKDTKIITVEDPVEVQILNSDQITVNNHEVTIPAVVRQALRLDPDVLYVSEIRDYETAHLLMEGVLNGHLIFTVLTTENAIDALFRFSQMGIKEYLSGSVIKFIINTRLAKKICTHCKEKAEYQQAYLKGIGMTGEDIKKAKLYKGKGCDKCNNTGYSGRIAIVEMLELNSAVRDSFINGSNSKEITKIAKKEGVYYTHSNDAINKFKSGLIDLDTVRMFTL